MVQTRKYRGLTKEGNWVYGWYSESWAASLGYRSIGSHIRYLDKDNDFQELEVIPETVGQFTGLKDKNGTEIYEGDIIQSGKMLVIDWDTYNAYWGTYNKKNEREFGLGSWNLDRFEVIGNIHQNPEFMEQE